MNGLGEKMNLQPGRAVFSLTIATLLLGATPALAQERERGHQGGSGDHFRRSVPEFDPTTVGAIVALMVGGGVLLARRRR